MNEQGSGFKVGIVLFALVIMHFTVRPLIGHDEVSPDFMLLALMFYAIRSRPGHAAVAGFSIGIIADALSPVAVGSSALAHTVVAYLQAWGKAVFFPDNLLVTAGFLFAGTWTRNFLVMLAGSQVGGVRLFWTMGTWSLAQAITTTIMGLAVLLVFRRWFKVGLFQ